MSTKNKKENTTADGKDFFDEIESYNKTHPLSPDHKIKEFYDTIESINNRSAKKGCAVREGLPSFQFIIDRKTHQMVFMQKLDEQDFFFLLYKLFIDEIKPLLTALVAMKYAYGEELVKDFCKDHINCDLHTTMVDYAEQRIKDIPVEHEEVKP